MSSLHITLTELKNQSRLLKEAESLIRSNLVDKLYIAALHADGLLRDEKFGENIRARRFALRTRKYSKNLFFQTLKYLEFSFRVYAGYKDKHIRVINVHTLSLLPLGVILKRIWGAKLVYDTHELETETSGLYGVRKKLSKWVERALIDQVDLTIVVSESIADWYANAYRIPRPVVVLNACHQRKLMKKNHFRLRLGIKEEQKILLYQGGLVHGRGVSLILEAFRVRKDNNVVAVFMGYGSMQSDIEEFSKKRSNVFFYPAVSPSSVLEYTSSADMGIHLIQNTCLNHFYCMPNKLFEYAMAGLPVLVSDMKEMAAFVEGNSMGSVIKEFSPEAINHAIDLLLAQDIEVLHVNAHKTGVKHAWEVQEAAMLRAYANLFI